MNKLVMKFGSELPTDENKRIIVFEREGSVYLGKINFQRPYYFTGGNEFESVYYESSKQFQESVKEWAYLPEVE